MLDNMDKDHQYSITTKYYNTQKYELSVTFILTRKSNYIYYDMCNDLLDEIYWNNYSRLIMEFDNGMYCCVSE